MLHAGEVGRNGATLRRSCEWTPAEFQMAPRAAGGYIGTPASEPLDASHATRTAAHHRLRVRLARARGHAHCRGETRRPARAQAPALLCQGETLHLPDRKN